MPTEQSFPSEGISALEIDLKRGDIAVDVGEGDQITLRADFSSGASEADLQIEPVGGTLRIVQSPADVEREGFGFLNDLGLGHLMGHLGRIDLRLSVPAGSRRLLAKTGLGSVWVAKWSGDLQARSGKGDVTLGAVDGETDATSGMGAVRLERFSGRCHLNSGLGDITVLGGEGNARVNSGKGTVRVADLNGTLDATSGMGEVVLDRVAGQAKIRSGFGQLRVTDARELALEANTGNGNLQLAGDFRSIRAKSGMGAIACQPTKLAGSSELHTGNGDIDLDLATGQAVRIDASTGRGRIESDIPLVQVGQSGPEGYFSKRVVGTTAPGEIAATLRLRTGNGNIRLHQPAGSTASRSTWSEQTSASASASGTGASTTTATITVETSVGVASPEPAPAPGRTRLEILQALSRGEITIDEAERLLRT